MADIQYLNYGDLQIELLAFLNKAANEVLAYVLNLSWSKKRKEKFMSAYSDLMNRGILGASNSTGQWMIDVGGDALPFDTMSEKDKEMYQEAAYFIQQQMQGLPTRTLEEEKKEEDKTKLPLFDNKAFTSSFINHISTSDFGGQDFHIGGENDNWNKLDARDSNGIRGKQKRTEALKNYLISYRDKFDDSKYNFEGSPFENAQDFRNRLDNAINALNTPDTNDDELALNKLGLNPADWFNNGSGDPSGKFLNDKELTYAELAEYNLKQNELKQLLLKELARNNFLSFGTKTSPKLVGRSPVELKTKYGDGNGLLNALYGYSLRGLKDLNADELSELQGAYRHLAKDPIDNNLLKQLLGSSSGLYRGASPNRFKKINGIDNFIWDSTTGQVIQIQNRDEYEASRNLPTDLFAGVLTKEDIQNTPISKEGWTSADTADVVSMIGDLVSLGGFWANVGGTATSLTSDLYADISRGKDLGDILKGVGVNLGWGLAGMLPGAKSTKLVARTARLIPKAIMAVLSAGIILDPEVLKSAMKFTTVDGLKTVSSKDLENLKYLFHAVTGGTNIVKSHVRAKNYREQLNKLKVQTKEGTKNLSNKDVKEINKAGRKGGQKAAEDKFREKTGKESIEGLFKFSENGKSRFNPARYSSILYKMFGNDLLLKGELTTDLRAMSQILQKDKELPWYNWNKGYATFELTPFRNNPPIKLEKTKQKTNNLLQNLSENKSNLRELQFNRATINKYKEHLKGNFSNKKLQSGEYDLSGNNLRVVEQSDGTFNIIYKGNIEGNYLKYQQKELQKRIFDLVKENRKLIDKSGTITKKSTTEIGKILQDLKRKGWLREGGKIDKQKIQNYKEFINK